MMRAALWGAVMLLPIATAADDTVPARFDCLFKPYVGGQLVSGEIISSETFVQTPRSMASRRTIQRRNRFSRLHALPAEGRGKK